MILNTTLWTKDKSLVIIGFCLVLNNLFNEYSGSRYSGFSLWLNPRKVRKILFSLGESQKFKLRFQKITLAKIDFFQTLPRNLIKSKSNRNHLGFFKYSKVIFFLSENRFSAQKWHKLSSSSFHKIFVRGFCFASHI